MNQNHFLIGSLLLLSLLFAKAVKGQNCDSLMASVLGGDVVFAEQASVELSKRDIRRNLEEEVEGLRQILVENLSARILLEVKSSTTSMVEETTESYEDFYFSETEITTEVMLSNGSFDYCLDRENRRLYGIYAFDPIATANATVRDAELRLLRLNAQVEEALAADFPDDPYQYRAIADGVRQDLKKAVFLDPGVDLAAVNYSLEKFTANYEKLLQESGEDSFGDEFADVQKTAAEGLFSKAIVRLREIKARYPHRNEIAPYLGIVERRYTKYYEREVKRFRARKEYPEALEVLKGYCSLMDCGVEEYQREESIRREFFDESHDRFEEALRFDHPKDVGIYLSLLRSMADIDPSTYQKAEDDYRDYQLAKELERVEKELNQENYRTARTMALRLRDDYGNGSTEIRQLIDRAEKEIYLQRVKKERKTRRMLWAVALGTEVTTNEVPDLWLFPDGISHYTVGYSLGLYKKFNYYKRYNGHYPKGSDIVGFKARIFDHLTQERVPWDAEELPFIEAPNRFSLDLLLDGTAFYVIHYSGGLVFPRYDKSTNFHYCAELGLRIPMGPFSLQGNIRTDWIESIPTSSFAAGIFLQLDFWRDFGRKDRAEIKNDLGF